VSITEKASAIDQGEPLWVRSLNRR